MGTELATQVSPKVAGSIQDARGGIPLAIPSLSPDRLRRHQLDDRPDPTCGDASRWHQADVLCLTSNPLVAGSSPAGGAP